MSTHEPVVTQQILDLISSKSDEQRAAREMSKEVVDALKECGFFTMLLPNSGVVSSVVHKNFLLSKYASLKPT